MKCFFSPFAAAYLIAMTATSFAARAERPNVLFIAIDDLKPLLGCYGETEIKSPNIDRLAGRGMTFLNAHCQQAVCAPSRISLLTGLLPDTTRVWDLKTNVRDNLPDVVTLPQYFKRNGYEVVGMGKIFDPRSVGGRDEMDARSWTRPYIHVESQDGATYSYLNPDVVARINAAKKSLKGKGWDAALKVVGKFPTDIADVPDNAYFDGAMADTGVQMIGELSKRKKPFFLAVGFKKPHLPFNAPKKYWDLYDRDELPLAEFTDMPANAPEHAYQPGWELRNYDRIPKEGPLPEALQRELIHGYYACTSYIDVQVGKLLDALDESPAADNTIVILWGDHGWHLGDHSIWCKHTNYEQATRVPLILAPAVSSQVAPACPQAEGRSTDNAASIISADDQGNAATASALGPGAAPRYSRAPDEFLDIFPTLCELSGIRTPGNLHGTSLLPLLKNPKDSIKEVARSQYPRHSEYGQVMGYAYRDTRYRYIEWVKKDAWKGETTGPVVARELYDYDKDPLETRNLVDDPAYREVIAAMQAKIKGL